MNDQDDRFKQRIKQKLAEEGEDFKSIRKRSENEIRRILQRIARRLNITFEQLIDALRRIGEVFGDFF